MTGHDGPEYPINPGLTDESGNPVYTLTTTMLNLVLLARDNDATGFILALGGLAVEAKPESSIGLRLVKTTTDENGNVLLNKYSEPTCRTIGIGLYRFTREQIRTGSIPPKYRKNGNEILRIRTVINKTTLCEVVTRTEAWEVMSIREAAGVAKFTKNTNVAIRHSYPRKPQDQSIWKAGDLVQKVAIEIKPGVSAVVLAAAGSGKTAILTKRVAYLIKQGITPSEILVTTFTRKAAEELTKRLASMDITRVTVGTMHSIRK